MQSTYSLLAALIIMGIISSTIAKAKGRNHYFWFAMGILFSLFGILILLWIPSKKKEKVPTPSPSGISKMNSEAALPADEENFGNPTPPVKRIKPDTSLQWYYIYETEKIVEVRGPLSVDDLRKAFVNLKLPISTYIWCDEFADWTPLAEFQNISYLTDKELILDDHEIAEADAPNPEAGNNPPPEPKKDGQNG